jgi:hypothetical protein
MPSNTRSPGNINASTPRDDHGRRQKRDVPEDVIVDIVARRTMGESLRAIEKATGVPRSTVSELLHKPDVVAMVAEIQADIAASENLKVEAVRDAKRSARRAPSRAPSTATRPLRRSARAPRLRQSASRRRRRRKGASASSASAGTRQATSDAPAPAPEIR